MSRSVLFIDNLDSFSFNLVDAFERQGCRVRVLRNSVSAAEAFDLARAERALIVLSPGPGIPDEAGCCMELVRLARGHIPLLGICLGHQAIAAVAGAEVDRAATPVHGKPCTITHVGRGAFQDLPSPLRVGRYHSLIVNRPPPHLAVTARCGDEVMAIADEEGLQVGLQFHPESILTPAGDRILQNVLSQWLA